MPISVNFERRQRILKVLLHTPLDDALLQPAFREDLEAEANYSEDGDPNALITPAVLDDYLQFADIWRPRKSLALRATRGARVIVVPGFMGSTLSDRTGDNGLIWIDPTLAVNGGQLNALRLKAFQDGIPERDDTAGVTVQASGCVPLTYDLLGWFLWMNGYSVTYAPFDWRKHLDESARQLESMIRDQYIRSNTPVRLIAHSQGSLVARRALQLLGPTEALQMVQMLVLLGPATFGTFSAALAISGSHDQIDQFRRWAIGAPADTQAIFQSMTGLYQLVPWNKDLMPGLPNLGESVFWETGVDKDRLTRFFGWSKQIDARFFNDRTRIILGDAQTVDEVEFQAGHLVPTAWTDEGDGTVSDRCAKINGVLTFKAPKATHALMGANYVVCKAVINLLTGATPKFIAPAVANSLGVTPEAAVRKLVDDRVSRSRARSLSTAVAVQSPVAVQAIGTTRLGFTPVEPPFRRLRVFAMDPLLSLSVDTADYAEMVVELDWNDIGAQPAPVGEYLEVVDVDPQSGKYYPPVDLNHPYLLAQDGLKPSEQNPQFHQQMTYAVSMATVRVFEKALGRVALWSPRLQRDKNNKVINQDPESQYVQRLRLYPHAMRQRNAFYDPDRKAILFGYFPADGGPAGRVVDGGMIFTSSSFDIIAHETTHALLDGLHRYLIYPSNPDVLAFHEGFSDIVALLQRFANREFLRVQIARSGGDLTGSSLLGQLAGQFAEGTGGKGNGLRQYLGRRAENGAWQPTTPEPGRIADESEPHDRGAILVAAVFRALEKIYQRRASDLFRIANRLQGSSSDLTGNPDLVNRLAYEAAKSAAHLLRMCVRALDYLPPVDLTLGEYLRALITADYDLVRDDDYRYRVAVVDAFREWGIYPAETHTLLESDLIWQPPDDDPLPNLIKWVETERKAGNFADWMIGADRRRAFCNRAVLGRSLHDWILNNLPSDHGRSLGICLDPTKVPSINRDRQGTPKFEIHAVHPCSRVGPDGQQLQDLVVEIVQRRRIAFDSTIQKQLEDGVLKYEEVAEDFSFRGGCTLILDGHSGAIRYVIRKGILNQERLEREISYRRDPDRIQLGMSYFERDDNSPFRLLHQNVR